jgi:hypothetical protein
MPFKLINNKLKIENSIPNFLKSDGHYTQTPIESMEYALNETFPLDNVESETEVHKTIRQYVEQS